MQNVTHPFRVRGLDEHGVEPGGGDGGEHDPGRAAHQVAPPAPDDMVARWQKLIPSFPWTAPGWRAWGHNWVVRGGKDFPLGCHLLAYLCTTCKYIQERAQYYRFTFHELFPG